MPGEPILVESGSTDDEPRPLVDVPLPGDALAYLPYDYRANACQDSEAYVWPEDDE